jgi:hypothetical protein
MASISIFAFSSRPATWTALLVGGSFGKELAADAIMAEIGQMCLDADDMVHAASEFAERIPDAFKGRTHLLFERDAALVGRQRHADLAKDEDPAAGLRIDAERLAKAGSDRARQVFYPNDIEI